jgi:hypothetical protein
MLICVSAGLTYCPSQVLTVKRALEGVRQGGGGRMSVGTPLGGQDSGPFLGPSSSGSSRGGSMPPPPPGAMGPGGALRSGSYSSGSQHQMPRLSGRGGSGSGSPMHPGGGHRYSPHHPHMGSPGGGRDPFGPHAMMGAHPGSYPPMGFYMAGEGLG